MLNAPASGCGPGLSRPLDTPQEGVRSVLHRDRADCLTRLNVAYEADFEYQWQGQTITEDVKGFITPDAKRKIKQFQARYNRLVYIVTDYRDHIGGKKNG